MLTRLNTSSVLAGFVSSHDRQAKFAWLHFFFFAIREGPKAEKEWKQFVGKTLHYNAPNVQTFRTLQLPPYLKLFYTPQCQFKLNGQLF